MNKRERMTPEQYEALKQNKRSNQRAGFFTLEARARLTTK